MPPGRIEVFCRVRPTDKLCSAQVHLLPDNVSVQITRPARTGNNNNNNNNSGEGSAGRSKMEEHGENVEVDSTGNTLISNYTFDGVLSGNAATQENVFKTTTAKMVESGVMNGSNATLLSYGQRGSGKTYTIFGGTDYRSRGIAPRVIHHLFTAMADMKNDRSYKVSMTFLQLNGEQVSDLLAGQPPAGGKVSLSQQNKAEKPVVSIDGKGEVLLRGIIKRPCESESDALAALFEGLQNHRAQQQVGFRPAHLALTLYVAHQSLTESESETRHGCFHMVDLAGAQRVDGLTDPIAKTEAQQINKSLSMLEQVVIALSNSSTSSMEGDTDNAKVQHIPYRQSKLTTLLKGSMGGHSLTTLIAHIFPEKQFVDATVATLNFAKRMMRVSTDPRVNVIVDTGAQMRSLQRQLTDLRAELRLQGQLNAKSSGGGVGGASGARGSLTAGSASSLGVDELQVIHDKVHAFVDGNNATIQITDVREMHACFAFMRNMVEQKDLRINELKSQVSSAMTTAHAQGGGGGTGGSSGGYSSSAGEGGGAGQGGGAASAGNARGGRGAASKRSSMSRRNSNIPPTEKVDTFTPSVLDKNSGVGYGTSAKPSQVLPENRDAMQPVSSVGNGAPAGTAAKPSWDAPTTYHPGKSGEELQPNAVGKSALKGFTGGNVPPLQPARPGTILATGGAAPPNLGAPTFGVGSLGNAAAGQTTFVGSPGVPPTMAAAASAVAAGRFQKPNPTTPLTALPPAAATTNSTSARGRPNAPTLVQVAPAPPPQPLPPATSHSQRSARPPLGPQRGGSSHDMVSTTTSMLLSRQQQGTTGDAGKGVAFEDYKRTPSGALQVRAMNEDQQQLMSVQERIGSLERRLQGLSTVIGYQRGSVSGGGGVGFTHTTTSSHAMGDELGTGGTPAPRGSQSDDGAPHMTPVQAVAYSHSLQDNLGKAKSEQAHLVKQIERRRMAFLQNFDEWYIQLGGIVDDAYGGDYGAEGFPRIRAVDGPAHAGGMRESMKYLLTDPDANPEALQGLMDINGDKFLDAAERFDAMELNRQIAQDPDSAAFFNAKKLIEVRSRSGKGRRGH